MDIFLIRDLAIARENKARVKDAMKAMQDELTSSPEYKSLISLLSETVQTEIECFTIVKEAAMTEYEKTGEKHPHEAITIKEYSRNEILDYEKAREWCFTNLRPALSLDEKAFIDMAKKGRIPEDLIKSYSEFLATVSQDLTKYLDVV